MARVLVTDDHGERILLDEHVQCVHLRDSHASHQMVERLAWAVEDAERRLEVGLAAHRTAARKAKAVA